MAMNAFVQSLAVSQVPSKVTTFDDCHACLGAQVWAYANLGYDPGALIDAVAQASEHRMREFSPQNVSNILWAYAKLGERSPVGVCSCVSA